MVSSTFSSSSSSSSSPSSSTSFSLSSVDDDSVKSSTSSIKFLCSYCGRILPRYPDGRLRYVGGETRVLAVDRFVLFSELLTKFGELCEWKVEAIHLRFQLPTRDLDDALICVTSDEDLSNLVEEYDVANRDRASPLKIRAFILSKFPNPLVSAASSAPLSAKGKIPIIPPPSSSHRRFSQPSLADYGPCNKHRRHHQQQQYSRGYGGWMVSSYRNHAAGGGHVHLVHNGHQR